MDIDGKTVILASHKPVGKKTDEVMQYGTLARVLSVIKSSNGSVQVNIQTTTPVKMTDIRTEDDGELSAEATEIAQDVTINPQVEALRSRAGEQIKILSRARRYNYELIRTVLSHNSLPLFLDATISAFGMGSELAQRVLIAENYEEKLKIIIARLDAELQNLDLDNTIKSRINQQMSKAHREVYLNEKMKAIQRELGEREDCDANSLKQKIAAAKLPKDVNEKALSELKKLRNLQPMSSEASVIKNWLDEILALPWNKRSDAKIDLNEAEKIMNEDHEGLEKIKERILEHLAVMKQTGKSGGAILCFVGPPGVGKTSLGKSIARATGRQYARMSLGGVADEAHFRGHRKTYIGSQPGRIIDMLKRAKVKNPLVVLDEIDKLGRDYRGDPEAALLEILDPEQNKTFRDHYLESDFDLSEVMFVATANSYKMSQALIDRMEIIDLSGYVEDEKIRIAQSHLIKNAAENMGINPSEISISIETLRHMVRYYTMEAGVRELYRLIEKLLRKSLRAGKKDFSIQQIEEWLGVRKYDFRSTSDKDSVGIISGLSYTDAGGNIIPLEASTIPGKGNIIITGHLGEIMKESAQIAKSCAQSMAAEFGINPEVFEKTNIHVHALDGGVPKEGPSAGLAICAAILSALSNIPIRRDVALTGEISLHGKALPIGGLREKLLGARRGGISIVIMPEKNRKDLADIPEYIFEGMELKFVNDIREVIEIAFTTPPMPIAPGVRISSEDARQ